MIYTNEIYTHSQLHAVKNEFHQPTLSTFLFSPCRTFLSNFHLKSAYYLSLCVSFHVLQLVSSGISCYSVLEWQSRRSVLARPHPLLLEVSPVWLLKFLLFCMWRISVYSRFIIMRGLSSVISSFMCKYEGGSISCSTTDLTCSWLGLLWSS